MRDFLSDSNFRVQNLKNPTFLMRICWSWNLNPSPERLWEMQNLIFYPPQMSSCVCVCVFASGRLECNSSDEVTCWSLFKHCPRTPDPLDQTCQCPRQLTRWLRLLAHITSHLSQSLPMIAMIWHYVFCDPPQTPVTTLVGASCPPLSVRLALFPTAPSALSEHHIRDH